MHELEGNADSVYYLITLLCRSLKKHHGLESDAPSVAKLKAQSFEILLKKSQQERHIKNDEDDNPHRKLDMQMFGAKLQAHSNPQKWALYCKYKEQLQFVSNEAYFQEHPGRSILQFLLALQNVEESTIIQPPDLLVPGPFTLHSMQMNKYYPTEINTEWVNPRPKNFKGIEHTKININPFKPKFFVERESQKLPPLKTKFDAKKLPETKWNITTNKCSEFENFGPKPRAFRLPVQEQPIKKCNLSQEERVLKTFGKISQHEQKQSAPRCFAWNWESLGCFGIPKNKQFVCESQMSLHLKSIDNLKLGLPFQTNIMTMAQFMQDLKALTVGIQSDTFQHNDLLVFEMQANVTVKGLLPSTLKNYVEPFLECGSCFKRLKTMIQKKDYKLLFDGFMFRALCSALDEYLFSFRQFVFAKNDEHLIAYFKRMKKSMQLMRNLSFALDIHPHDLSNRPPLGSQFLGFLYREILRSTEHDFITLLMFILKRCCHVYFKHLQQWIFNGVLDDPSNELFIGYNEHTRTKTKHFYDKAYFLRKESVPGFFQTYEQQILQCGKYTILLKSFKPNHPIFEIQHPALTVCLTFEEMQKQEIACLNYKREAAKLFYQPISVKDVLEERKERKNKFFDTVNKRAIETLEKWLDEQHALALITAEQKRKLYAELTAQLEEARRHKIAQRRASVELELKALREAEVLQEKRLLGVNINLQKRIEYYQELHELLEQDMQQDGKSVHLSTGSRTPGTRTSPSTGDFLSCDDGETDEKDVEEEFSECWSENFEERFAETEKELEAYNPVHDNDLNANPQEIDENITEICALDTINSNEQTSAAAVVVLSNMQQNKLNMLSGANMQQCLGEDTEIEKAEAKAAVALRANTPLTEAQRNKLRVLTQEYDQPLLMDANLNTLPESEWSDLQRNRKRMMANVPFTATNNRRATLRLNLLTDASQIKSIITPQELDVQHICTPMSTTSDVSICEQVELDKEQEIREDAKNNNTSLEVPAINITAADDTVEESSEMRESFLTLDDSGLIMDYKEPYERCEELLNTNFKCKSRCALIRLNTLTNNSKKAYAKKSNLNVMSVITLTEFLQKSVIIPLQTHFEIINNEVMRMFLNDIKLLEHLRSLRNYFLLMDGEFGSIICDNIIQQLEDGTKPNILLNYQTLHGILETALASSITGNNKNAENLSFIVSDIPDAFDLASPHALSILTLSYRTPWPLNLILNAETLEKYSTIFKHLLKVRRIGWVLERVFHILKKAVSEHGKEILKSPQYRRIQQMRHKFYHFVHALQNHITATALQASWKNFKDDLIEANCIEDIYRKHTKYLKRVLFLCMLNRKSIGYLTTIENIFKVALKFYHNLKSHAFQKSASIDEHLIHPRYDRLVKYEQEFDRCCSYVIYLSNKIVRVGYQEELSNFITLINLNNYYIESKQNDEVQIP